MVWDGECGFCHYWIIRWKMITGDKIEYNTFQNVAGNFPDIPVDRFREAVRLIETDGSISSGPKAAFRSLS
ncbi:MAG: thiol-disulfide oxidoreductase DCC family protein, partial [Bacteroidia bacterium]